MHLSKNIILLATILTIIFFFDMIKNYQPTFASDWNSHWAYLAGTTFGIVDSKWVFQIGFMHHGTICFVHTYLGQFFLAYKINIIDVREAAMFTMLFGSFLLKLITIFWML